ncbi:MAG: nickel-dependent lactate racemase, partial [Desulfobacterales bacterium]|nr:nickel-dependent lactate racemase [Desulfobacterales bacterium]
GLTEETVGAEIRSSLETVDLGTTPEGIPVELDRHAWEADHIVLINRLKKHTDFMGEFESGLMKIMGIGLGKISGAEVYHTAMMNLGASPVIKAVGRHVMSRANILMGLGTIENGYGDVADIGIFGAQDIEAGEKDLLGQSKAISPSLPVDAADIILIDEIGKEISGAGFDTRVVGRIRLPGTPEPEKPDITRIILSDLTEISHGNACGFGLADIITARLAGKVDQETTDINTIVSMALEMGKTPLTMPSDKEALGLAVRCIGMVPPEDARIIRIKNTLCLEEVDLSAAFLPQIQSDPGLEIISGPRPFAFDADGYLTPFFDEN